MKRILTLIVTLVCVFAAYSQNTVYIWRDKTLSVQAADSLTIDRSTGKLVDLGLSVLWAKSDASSSRCNFSDAKTAAENQGSGYRLPTEVEVSELVKQCIRVVQPDNRFKLIGPNGNSIILNTRLSGNRYRCAYWTSDTYGDQDTHILLVFDALVKEDQVSFGGLLGTSFGYFSESARAVRSY